MLCAVGARRVVIAAAVVRSRVVMLSGIPEREQHANV